MFEVELQEPEAPRLATICRAGREMKMHRLLRDIPPQWSAEIFATESLGQAQIGRLAEFDVVFYKSRAERLLRLLVQLEERAIKVVNSVAAVRSSKGRFKCLELVANSSVPTARQYQGPLCDVPFDRFVVKSAYENERVPTVVVRSERDRQHLMDRVHPNDTIYAQAYIDSKWEYKLYCIGGEVFGFRQRPTATNLDAQSDRHRIEIDPSLWDFALRAMDGVGLDVGGVDFLFAGETPRVTDLNSTPGLHKFPDSSAALFRHFDRCLSGR